MAVARDRRHLGRWTEERRAQFARDWNDGMPFDTLREKYGIRHVAVRAALLRRRGLTLTRRRTGPQRKEITP